MAERLDFLIAQREVEALGRVLAEAWRCGGSALLAAYLTAPQPEVNSAALGNAQELVIAELVCAQRNVAGALNHLLTLAGQLGVEPLAISAELKEEVRQAWGSG